MAYVVARRNGSWEIREAHSSSAGPRSRTLATFRTLTPEVIEAARARSLTALEPGQLERAARRAGAPTARSAVDQSARDLLAALSAGARPAPVLRRMLALSLPARDDQLPDSARAAAPWVAATPHQRARALHDLLLLVDKLPPRPRRARQFPRIESAPA